MPLEQGNRIHSGRKPGGDAQPDNAPTDDNNFKIRHRVLPTVATSPLKEQSIHHKEHNKRFARWC
jgi:hypothetical protein